MAALRSTARPWLHMLPSWVQVTMAVMALISSVAVSVVSTQTLFGWRIAQLEKRADLSDSYVERLTRIEDGVNEIRHRLGIPTR